MAITPGGRTHKILDRLSEGDALVGHLFHALGYPQSVTRQVRGRFWRLMDYLQAEAMVIRGPDRLYSILPRGEEELHRLNQQARVIASGNVRIFRKEAA